MPVSCSWTVDAPLCLVHGYVEVIILSMQDLLKLVETVWQPRSQTKYFFSNLIADVQAMWDRSQTCWDKACCMFQSLTEHKYLLCCRVTCRVQHTRTECTHILKRCLCNNVCVSSPIKIYSHNTPTRSSPTPAVIGPLCERVPLTTHPRCH